MLPTGQICEIANCGKPVEPDGFCSWHGKLSEKWQCDDCVHKERGRSQSGIRPPDPYTVDQIRQALEVIESNIRNMAMINYIDGMDASTASRSLPLSLNFRDSKAVYRLIAGYLRAQLPAEQPSPPIVPEVPRARDGEMPDDAFARATAFRL